MDELILEYQNTGNRTAKSYCWLGVVSLCIGSLSFGFGGACGKGLEKVKILGLGTMNFNKAGYFSAIDQGYYAEEGLDVELVLQQRDYSSVLQSVKDEVGVYGSVSVWALREHFSGRDYVVFGTMYQPTNVGLLVNRGLGIESPEDLAGRRIRMMGGEVSVEVRAMLYQAGVWDQVEVVEETGAVQEVLNGTMDGLLVRFNPRTIELLVDAPIDWSMFMPYSYDVRIYKNVMFTSRAEADKHPERVRAFYRATVRGFQYAWSHPSEVIDQYLELSELDTEARKYRRHYFETQAWYNFGRIEVENQGPLDPARFRKIADSLVALGDSPPVDSLDDFLFDPTPEADYAWVKWVIGGAVVVALLAIGILVWNRQLSIRVKQRTHSLEESEVRRRLMMQELDHRVKNNLATVLSLSHQTLGSSESLKEFDETFSGRLVTMAKSHEALAADSWSGIDFGYGVEMALGPYMGSELGRVVATGPKVCLPAHASIPMSLALHELSTNAVKYGALSEGGSEGRVELSWVVDDEEVLTVLWEEIGGPEIEGPIEAGLGTVLIKDLLEYELKGKVKMRFEREGLCCEMKVSLADVKICTGSAVAG